MITKYNEFVNESLRSKMTGVSDEEIIKKLSKLSDLDKVKQIIKYKFPDEYIPEQYSNLVNDDDLKSVLSKLKTFIEMEDASDYDFERCFSWRDDPSEVWKSSPIEERLDLILKMIDTGIEHTIIRRNLSKDMTQQQIDDIIYDDDLNDAMSDLQNMMGIKYGDQCGMFFSIYDDADSVWSNATPELRKEIMDDYLDSERSSYE